MFRDLATLKEAGVPLFCDPETGNYCVPGTYFLPPTNFTTEEALAVIVLCHELGDQESLPFYEAASAAAIKLENVLPKRLRDYLRRLTDRVHIQLDTTNPLKGKKRTYAHLMRAVGERKMIRISYDSYTDNQVLQTKLAPYSLLFSRRSWYVIGRSSLHQEVRTFNVGRILNLEITSEKFQRIKGFTVEKYLGNAWSIINEKPVSSIEIEFSPLVARNVSDVLWHKTQKIIERRDGSILFQAKVAGFNEIVWWILGYGGHAKVLKPKALQNMVAQEAQKMVTLYGFDTELKTNLEKTSKKTTPKSPKRLSKGSSKSTKG